jgi:hypothetical protein
MREGGAGDQGGREQPSQQEVANAAIRMITASAPEPVGQSTRIEGLIQMETHSCALSLLLAQPSPLPSSAR